MHTQGIAPPQSSRLHRSPGVPPVPQESRAPTTRLPRRDTVVVTTAGTLPLREALEWDHQQ